MADQVKPAAPAAKKVTVYIATAPFVMDGNGYNEGDEVVLPGWMRDLKYDAQRKDAAFGESTPNGLSFYKEGPEIDRTAKERNLYRVTLPVKEQ